MNRDDLPLALSVAALVPSIYSVSVPSLAAVRGESDIADAAAAERYAALSAGALVVGVGLAARSPLTLVLGGAMVLALHNAHARAQQVNP